MDPHLHWIVTADGRGARLLVCRQSPGRKPQLEVLESIENQHEDRHERQRPTLVGGTERLGPVARSGAHATPRVVSIGHTVDEERRRFARDVAAWISRVAARHGHQKLTVFAPPRLLGMLREEFPGGAAPTMHEYPLTNLTPGELAEHPAVIRATACE